MRASQKILEKKVLEYILRSRATKIIILF